MRCRVKSSRVTGRSGIECNCNGRRTRRTVAHSELFGARRGAAVVGTVRAAHVANRALSITFQVLSDGWVTGVDSGERFLMAATKTALFTGPRRIPGNCRTPPRISSSSLYLYSIVASWYGTEIVRTNRRFAIKLADSWLRQRFKECRMVQSVCNLKDLQFAPAAVNKVGKVYRVLPVYVNPKVVVAIYFWD